jgi:hypothetical protein
MWRRGAKRLLLLLLLPLAGGGERAPNKILLHAEEDGIGRAVHWRQLTYFCQFIFWNLFVLPPYLVTL